MQVNHTFSILPKDAGTFEMKVKVKSRQFISLRTIAEGTMKFTLSNIFLLSLCWSRMGRT
ncbi:hypothetical protein BIW11_04343 [Tropilaelaps mercedesae]|uniref:Uncharacterized protein n=1 Tax=Tropilaelaps mercedesae TaxID=418985 RepID=A0A1V9X7K9_9ACAR|nr:hypothetical protein BIW11_04343 [Tropilaelaps mercedesae]